VPVVAGFDYEALVVEAEHGAARDRLLAPIRQDQGRPPLDGGALVLLDRLAEVDVLGPRFGKDAPRVLDRRLRLAERRGAEDAVGRV
jgi:hypothetical protein